MALGHVSRSEFNLFWLSMGHMASLRLTLAVLDDQYHKPGNKLVLLTGFFYTSKERVHEEEAELLKAASSEL